MTVYTPTSEGEVRESVVAAQAARRPFVIRGGGTRTGLGRPAEAQDVLSTSMLRGITLYEPAELVIAAKAGTPLAEIEAQLAVHRQRLPFEPMDHRAEHGIGNRSGTDQGHTQRNGDCQLSRRNHQHHDLQRTNNDLHRSPIRSGDDLQLCHQRCMIGELLISP